MIFYFLILLDAYIFKSPIKVFNSSYLGTCSVVIGTQDPGYNSNQQVRERLNGRAGPAICESPRNSPSLSIQGPSIHVINTDVFISPIPILGELPTDRKQKDQEIKASPVNYSQIWCGQNNTIAIKQVFLLYFNF